MKQIKGFWRSRHVDAVVQRFFDFLWTSEVSSVEAKHAGRVLVIGDGVASVAGLGKAKPGKMVSFMCAVSLGFHHQAPVPPPMEPPREA